jgi:hypothetical protein
MPPSAPWRDSLDGGAYMQSGAAEDSKGKIRQRSVRWMELWWKDTMTAAREEARTEDVLEMLRALVEDSQRGVQARAFLMRWESLW